jgi:hypothetical protein
VKYAAFFAFGVFVSGWVCLATFGPALDRRPTQKAVVAEFVARYCHPDGKQDPNFLMGEAAALSRVSIRSGLQPIAWTEYLKCKAGL